MENDPFTAPTSSSELTAPVIQPETITFRRSSFYLALLPVVFVLGLAAGFLLWGRDTGRTPGTVADASTVSIASSPVAASPTTQVQVATPEGGVTRYPVPEDGDPSFGPASAPVTIIEFSDFQCPYCKRWQAETYPLLQKAYPGKLRFVYRDFPLDSIHAEARPAAIAANCAGKQNKYWEFHDQLFSAADLSSALYASLARKLNLDTGAFAECQQDKEMDAEIEADLQYAVNLGIRSTPTFFINGIAVVGAQPFEVFRQVIDMELGTN